MSSEESATPRLNVVLMWHMHQPEYRDLRNGHFHQPWTYLHAIKDYVDMAAHLERHPEARAVVNFVPVLLDQIDDYAKQLENHLQHGAAIRDPLLATLADPVRLDDSDHGIKLIKDCLRANHPRMIERYPAYAQLAEMAEFILQQPDTVRYYDEQFFIDLVMWYHLAWIGETVKREHEGIKDLIRKKRAYTLRDRHRLVVIIHNLVSGLIGRFRSLAEQGRVELSMTPYAHPITPLLLDFDSTLEAMPDASMPVARSYPGGSERSEWHIERGLETFEQYFGLRPQGCWPAEGCISTETVRQLDQAGFHWLASGETVMRNSRQASGLEASGCLHCSYRAAGTSIHAFFRDDGLSDHIGFKFSDWHADDAVANLEQTLGHIAEACSEHPAPVVSIILDGENAWEYYPENGYYFLDALYKKLAKNPKLRLTTFSEYLKSNPPAQPLEKLVAGSWVYGTFSTWIGMEDKNRAWDMLVEAKRTFDQVVAQGSLSDEELHRAEMQLATCESSDWCWWFGDYNPAESVRAFDAQYRSHLCNLYRLLHRDPPDYLSHGFSSGSVESTASGVMLPGQQT